MNNPKIPPIEPAHHVADVWEKYGGPTPWSKAMREFGHLGGLCQYWCGMPRSASAIPLTFSLFTPDGRKFNCDYRLKDILAAIKELSVK